MVRGVGTVIVAAVFLAGCTGADGAIPSSAPPASAAAPPSTAASTTTIRPSAVEPTTTAVPTVPATTGPPESTTTLPPPAQVQGDPWPNLPAIDVIAARDGDLMLAGPNGVMLVRDGEPIGMLDDAPTQVAAPDGSGGFVRQAPFRLEQEGSDRLSWIPVTGGVESIAVDGTPLGDFALQEVDWVPRLGRHPDGAWIPTYTGLTALIGDSDHQTDGVLVTTGDPDWPADHFELYLVPSLIRVAALAWTGRHLVVAHEEGGGSSLTFHRSDGSLDVLPHNPRPEVSQEWIAAADAEPGSPLLAFIVVSGRSRFGNDTVLHVTDLVTGDEVLAVPIGGPDEEIIRIDLHDDAIAVSSHVRLPGGVSLDRVRLVDVGGGVVTSLPWGGTASFFHVAGTTAPAPYPIEPSGRAEIVVTAPVEGAVVNQPAIRFEGYATPGSEMTAAGRFPVAVGPDGRWATTLVLEPGGNVAVFAARDPSGAVSETARVVFMVSEPEMGFTLGLRYEREGEPSWVASVWVFDRMSLARLPGARVSLAVYGVGSVRETLVTDDAGIATLAGPIGDATSGLACLHGLDLAGYASPPVLEGADLPEGSVACVWASFP